MQIIARQFRIEVSSRILRIPFFYDKSRWCFTLGLSLYRNIRMTADSHPDESFIVELYVEYSLDNRKPFLVSISRIK